jgi:mannonate dehydratase
MMKIAMLLGLTRQEAEFARQAGLRDAVWSAAGTEKGYVTYEELQGAREFFQSYGLELGVIENVAFQYYDQVMMGLPGRDRQIDNFCKTLENMGRAGIPVLGYHWMALGGLTTDYVRVRGGALHRHFNMADALRSPAAAMEWRGPYTPGRVIHLPDREISTEQMWDNLGYFLERVLPVAEAAHVKLAAHPDDAPIPEFMGVARVLSSFDGFKRLVDSFPSPANGIDFCQGTFAEMEGLDVIEAIRYFGARKRIHFAHFRDTCGKVPQFSEVFMDDGDTDMTAAVRAFNEVGFDGLIRADHAPHMPGDNRYGQRSFAFQLGYMRGMFQAVDFLATGTQGKEG